MRILALLALLPALAACSAQWRQKRAEEDARLDRCSHTLPLLREEPSLPYRVVQLVEAYDEISLARYACAAKADAVISSFTENAVSKPTMGGNQSFATGRTRPHTEAKFIGRAIVYEHDGLDHPEPIRF